MPSSNPVVSWKERAHRFAGRLAEVRIALDRERELVRQLQQQILDMRREGFAPPPRPPEVQPAPEMAEPVIAALMQRARPGTSLWRELAADAGPLLAAGVSAAEVAKRILDGHEDPDTLLE